MRGSPRPRWRLLFLTLWLAGAGLLAAGILVFPVSSRFTRAGGVALAALVWFGLPVLWWRARALRYPWLAVSLLTAGFMLWPARSPEDPEALRGGYPESLRRYEGVAYVWGGEGSTGIDCSGLIRRGLIDTLFLRGLRTMDPGPVRGALALWWNDCSASDLGEGKDGLTVPVMRAKSLNALDHSPILPGDMAVTVDGRHILAYLGERHWIEADPAAGRVLILTAPSPVNPWLKGPVNIVRWRMLQIPAMASPAQRIAPEPRSVKGPPSPMIEEFYTAASSGDMTAVARMVKADPGIVSAKGKWGFTALHGVAGEELVEMAEYLLDCGADPNAGNDEGMTPLHLAAWPEMVKLLVRRGARLNERAKNGYTPLMAWAAEEEGYDVMETLLSLGADPSVKAGDGDTALDIATSREEEEKQALLKKHGAR